jgi:pimeloyl-ACP methyl ester carboxylesterase
MSIKSVFALLVSLVGLCVALPAAAQDAPTSGYADVNGLSMYYEVHGEGEPLVFLHGGYMSIDTMRDLVTRLAETRQVIAAEMQGHGRTADIDRPFSYEQLADDVVVLMDSLDVEKADVFGYSFGGGIALQLGIRHPERVDQLVVASMPYSSEGYHDGMMEMFGMMTADMFAGTPIVDEYARLAPNPDGLPLLVEKLAALDATPYDWAEAIQTISAPTLLIFGDADVIRPDHAVEMFGLMGGGANGDMVGLPNTQLAIMPGTTHISIVFQPDLLVSMVNTFLSGMPAFQMG